jgi:tetratricopeptide (TPR) repeat protein
MISMRFIFVAFAAAGLLVGAARAAEQPMIADPPAWVKPVAVPADNAKPDEAPIRILLSDEQVHLQPGRQSVYTEAVIRIQTPQGLAVGNLSLPWRPETDALTIHKLHIRRDGKVIDVLGSGQTFTVMRRETNLEMAMIDGVLTANIQPEGLQVGDTLEFAYTLTSSDPVLDGHVEHYGAGWNGMPIARAHLRATWPSSLPLKLRPSQLPPLKPTRDGEVTVVEVSLDNIEPTFPPKGAPLRYARGRLLEMSDFHSWSEVAALMAPLYAKAARVPASGPLRTELDRIRAASSDPKLRAEAALALVQDRIRYVALLMGTGGYVPADAESTWARRYGDCKAKTALLLALLDELDVQAVPVAVNTQGGDGLDERLPMLGAFDHVLVRAVIGGKTYWLDGTRSGDVSLDRLRVPAFYWGLPLVPRKSELVRMMPPPLEVPDTSTTIRIDATAGLTIPAPFHVESITRGDDAIGGNMLIAQLTEAQRERYQREYWKDRFDFVEVKSVSSSFDQKTGELKMVMDGLAKMEWKDGWYETDETSIGYRADFSRELGLSADAPFAVGHPFFNETKEIILLPPGFAGAKQVANASVNETVAGVEYQRKATLDGNVFTIESSSRSIAPEFSHREAATAQQKLRELYGRTVYLRRPASYRPTAQELAVRVATEPTNASEYFERGRAYFLRQEWDKAIVDFGEAMKRDPKYRGLALANRALAYVWTDEFEAAQKDLDAALALEPKEPVIYRARGFMAQKKTAYKEAIEAYGKSLELEPNNDFAFGRRAESYAALNETDLALADAAAALKLSPQWIDLYVLRANLLLRQGKRDLAVAEADAALAANPDIAYAHVAAAAIYSRLQKREQAMRAYDRALDLEPSPFIYLNRSFNRPKEDKAGRFADLDAALKLDPKDSDALAAKARLQVETGDNAGAIATLSRAIEAGAGDWRFLATRGIALARTGKSDQAEKDFAAVRAKALGPGQLNALCWEKATAGVALESALADCQAALAKVPDSPAFLDSRALVLLRLNRFDEAIADYDRALAKAPAQSASLFGRAVALARKGEKEKAAAALAAALKTNPKVREEFAAYGVTP